MTRPSILEAKLEKLVAVVQDGNSAKQSLNLDDVREAQRAAAEEILDDHASVRSVEDIELPSERV